MRDPMPEFMNPKTRGPLLAKVDKYALAQGFSQQEIDKMSDPRLMVMAYKAMMLDCFLNKPNPGPKASK